MAVAAAETITTARKLQWDLQELSSKDRKELMKFERQLSNLGIIGDALPKCLFCFHDGDDDGVLVGKMLRPIKNRQFAVHELCLLTAAYMSRQTSEDGPLLGFPISSVFDAFRKSITKCCYICGIDGGAVQCAVRGCKKSFHLFCGKRSLKYRTFHLYKEEFNAYCNCHYPELPLSLPQRIRKFPFQTTNRISEAECSCCKGHVRMRAEICIIIRTTCCTFMDANSRAQLSDRYYHFECIQHMAVTTGHYLLKCPFQCGYGRRTEGDYEDKAAEQHRQTFLRQITDQGIYVPIRDAKWEVDGSQLHMEPPRSSCSATRCRSSRGRFFNETTMNEPYPPWELLKCQFCGGKCCHRECAGQPYCNRRKLSEPAWLCVDCKSFSPGEQQVAMQQIGQQVRRVREAPTLICLDQPEEMQHSAIPLVTLDDDEPIVVDLDDD